MEPEPSGLNLRNILLNLFKWKRTILGFAIFGILAVALEAVGDRAKDLIKELEAVNLPVLTEISVLLTARLSNMATLPGLSVDSNLGLDDKHSEFVRRWVDRDFDLVG